MKILPQGKKGWMMLFVRLTIIMLILVGIVVISISMPGESYHSKLPLLSASEAGIRDKLRFHVNKLAGEIGERNVENPGAFKAAADYIKVRMNEIGLAVNEQRYTITDGVVYNIEGEMAGSRKADEIVIIGAHYDSVPGSPGANDNASGVAAILELARLLRERKLERTVRFVAFANEEPPFFQTDDMGSLVYAARCRARGEKIVAMLSIETIGSYSDLSGSQRYPALFNLFYPATGNFIGFVGDMRSGGLVRRSLETFRRTTAFPSEGVAAPGWIRGIGWSDHWSFSKKGYRAIMITDTAPFRYRHYHEPSDTPDKLHYDKMARVISGITGVVAELAGK